MPSSKIIKSAVAAAPISNFSFRSIIRGEALAPDQPAEGSGDFIPLEIFDPSELPADAGYTPPPPVEDVVQPELPPGQFVSDDELQNQLQESYQRGLQDGKNLAERGLLNVFRGLRGAAEDLQGLREKVLRDSEDDLLALVIAISRKVIHREVAQDQQTVRRLIRAAVADLHDSDDVVIRVHPDDYALLNSSQDQSLRSELEAIKFTFRADTTLTPGSCQVETSLGTVDASLEAQLEEIYRHLLEERTSVDSDLEMQGGP